MARRYYITASSPVTPGMLASAGRGDRVEVERSAATRADWGALTTAITIAFTRGAVVVMGQAGDEI